MAAKRIEKKFKLRKIRMNVIENTVVDCENFIKDENTSTEQRKSKVDATVETISKKMDALQTVDDSLIELLEDETKLEELIQSGTEFEIKINESLFKLKQFRDGGNEKSEKSATNAEKPLSSTVKLPLLKIKPFDGDILEWCSFFDCFESAINQKSNLSDIEKFTYLKSFLTGDAYRTIEGLTMTSENYGTALTYLEERYGNKDLIISKHMKELVNIEPVIQDDDVKGLREFYDRLEVHVRSLLSLKVDSSSYGVLLKSLLLEKLPSQVKLCITRDLSDSGWDLTKLLSTLRKELIARETCVFSVDEQSNENFTSSALFTNSKERKCAFCRGKHFSDKCDKLSDLEARKNHIFKTGSCFKCLKPNHVSRNCPVKNINCFHCKGNHNSAFCNKKFGTTNLLVNSKTTAVYLQTAVVKAHAMESREKSEKVRVIFDTGSEKSFISERLQKQLKLKSIGREQLLVSTFGGNIKKQSSEVVGLFLSNRNGGTDEPLKIKALVTPEICQPLSKHCFKIDFDKKGCEQLSDIHLAESGEGIGRVDVLIGLDHYWDVLSGEFRPVESGLKALNSKFGWILSGVNKGGNGLGKASTMFNVTHTLFTTSNKTLESEIVKFWDLETIGIRENDDPVSNMFFDDIKKNQEDRYEVPLPLKPNQPFLADNYKLCEERLMKKFKELKKDPELLKQYDTVIREQEKHGIIERTEDPGEAGRVHYLPHHQVIRTDKETTKLRVVFDASAKSNGTSLNDCLYKGPQMTPLLFDILIRFRQYQCALTTDIEKAFLQISVAPEHRDLLRFLWVDDIFSNQPKIVRNRFARVVFGVNSSPALLNGTIRKHCSQYLDSDNDFVKKVLDSFFVDDFTGGSENRESAFELYKTLKTRFLKAHFNLRKWRTNDDELRTMINEMEDTTDSKVTPAKILGIMWDERSDTLLYDVKQFLPKNEIQLTKRAVLSTICSFYDPLGIIQPLIVSLKILFQELCGLGVGWDDMLPTQFVKKWNNIEKEIESLPPFELQRKYFESIPHNSNSIRYELHGYSDASPTAYGAVVYLIKRNKKGNLESSIITSKSRVSPMKRQTIPRTELLGNLLLVRLMESSQKALQGYVTISETLFFTDSQVCLAWIKANDKEFNQFVQNRVNEIRKKSNTENWHYCPTELNPADLISKQINHPMNAISSELWLKGPNTTLYTSNADLNQKSCHDDFSKELKKSVLHTTVKPDYEISNIVDFDRYNSFRKLVRVLARVRRFISNLRSKIAKQPCRLTELTAMEISQSKEAIIKEHQRSLSDDPDANQIQRELNIQPDKNGILRCHGRLENAPLTFDTRCPIYLNKNKKLCELIVNDVHHQNKHSGVKQTLNDLRQQYWISKGRNFVRKLLNNCRVCKRYNGKAYNYPDPPPLTELRLRDNRPFSVIGVDLCGPLYVKNTFRGKELYKLWIVLYTCAASRGIVLDIVPSLSAEAFLRSLKRFVARRGCPDHVISDNGTNFVASETQAFAANSNILWHFNVPSAPWFGGFFERLVRIVKGYLKKQLGNARLSVEETHTMLLEIEAIINNRPITFIYASELEHCLTPNHLIFGRRLDNYGNEEHNHDADISKYKCDHTYQQKLMNILDHFWNRWRIEYLADLREQQRIKTKAKNGQLITNGDVVLVYEEKMPRQHWRKGVVTKLIYGKDNQVRGAEVRTPNSRVIKRPVSRLYPIECVNNITISNVYDNMHQVSRLEVTDKDGSTQDIECQQRPKRQAAELAKLKLKYH